MDDATKELYAKRYEWLRMQHWSCSPVAVVTKPKENVLLGTWCPHEALLDNFIDEQLVKS